MMHIVLLVHDLHFILVVYYTNQSDNILLSTTFLADEKGCLSLNQDFCATVFNNLRVRDILEWEQGC
jgi:hypothetical protein